MNCEKDDEIEMEGSGTDEVLEQVRFVVNLSVTSKHVTGQFKLFSTRMKLIIVFFLRCRL